MPGVNNKSDSRIVLSNTLPGLPPGSLSGLEAALDIDKALQSLCSVELEILVSKLTR